ncbi:hypothetical protein Y1Q_0012201 [Alligator mississippiensis]|uniref:Uncharacterized protein n=1 Tax=Alligator mississippiensis TaxID=8496 RepID=A0A151N5K2_ALLMI|nr:hypothetical protein Y1Q_0012201 [Alligator mississippiensis]
MAGSQKELSSVWARYTLHQGKAPEKNCLKDDTLCMCHLCQWQTQDKNLMLGQLVTALEEQLMDSQAWQAQDVDYEQETGWVYLALKERIPFKLKRL